MNYLSLLFLTAFIVSCQPMEPFSTKTKSKSKSKSARTELNNDIQKEEEETEDKRIDSKYSKKDVVGCLGEMAVGVPVHLAIDVFSTLFTGNSVDFNFSSKLIKMIKTDIEKFLEENDRVTPDHFYEALSSETIWRLELELLKSNAVMSADSLKKKKKKMAYAFLYFLEKGGEEGVSYQFTFDGRGDLDGTSRAVYSFNGSDLRTEAQDVGVCAYFRFTDIEVVEPELNEILCVNKKFETLRLKNSDEGFTLNVNIDGKKEEHVLDNFDIEDTKHRYYLRHNQGMFEYPEITMKIDKRSEYIKDLKEYYPNTTDEIDISIKYTFFGDEYKAYRLNCREYGDVEVLR